MQMRSGCAGATATGTRRSLDPRAVCWLRMRVWRAACHSRRPLLLQDTASWPALQIVQFCWATQFLLATHVCSYSCFTSQFSPDPAASNCWLSPQPAGTQGSACMGWPAAYPGVAQAAAPSPA